MRTTTTRAAGLAAVAALSATMLAACGSGSATTTAAGAQPTAAPGAPSPGGFRGRGAFDPAEFTKIRQCLAAAGIDLPTPSPRPSGAPSGTGFAPEGSPAQGFGQPGAGRRSGFGNVLRSPAAAAALKACGITLPTRPPGSSGTPTP
jgi:hypothetical protein